MSVGSRVMAMPAARMLHHPARQRKPNDGPS
jgi:hypothetical protein